MTRALFLGLSLLLHVAVVSITVVGPILRDPDLPPIYDHGIICIFDWPVAFDLRSALLGSDEREVRAYLQDDLPLPVSQAISRCVRYEYESGSSITILIRSGVAHAVWLGPAASRATGCNEPFTRHVSRGR